LRLMKLLRCAVATCRKRGHLVFFCCASAAVDSSGRERLSTRAAATGRYCAPGVATVEIPESVESFDGQGQHGEQPADQQTVGMMMTDMLETMRLLASLKPWFSISQRSWPCGTEPAAHCAAREIRQPVGFHHRAVRLVLAIEEHANGFHASVSQDRSPRVQSSTRSAPC